MKKQANETSPKLEILPGSGSGADSLPVPVPGAGHIARPLGLARINAIIPQTVDDAIRIATGIHKSGLAPNGLKNVEAITTVILQGLEIGLPPMMSINKIAVINGRPTVWGDAIPALLWSRGFKINEHMDAREGGKTAVCEIVRPEGSVITRTFSEADAKKAGLLGKTGPWQQYPERMLQMRARGFAARDGAADVLGGMYIAEEVIEGGQLEPFEGNSQAFQRKSSAEGKRDGSVKAFNELRAKIAKAEDMASLHTLRQTHTNDQGVPWADMPSRWADTLEEDFATRAKLDFGLDVEPWQYEQSDFEGQE